MQECKRVPKLHVLQELFPQASVRGYSVRVATIIISIKAVRGSFAAEIAVDAFLINIKLSRCIILIFAIYVSHGKKDTDFLANSPDGFKRHRSL